MNRYRHTILRSICDPLLWVCTVFDGPRYHDQQIAESEREAEDWTEREYPSSQRMPAEWRPWKTEEASQS